MKKLVTFYVTLFLLFGCATSQDESLNVGEIYMRQSLATGMMPVALDDALREDLGLPAIDGMYLANVEAKSAAASAKLKTGDILLQVGDEPVYDKESFARAFHAVEGNKRVPVRVWRGGGILTLYLPLGL